MKGGGYSQSSPFGESGDITDLLTKAYVSDYVDRAKQARQAERETGLAGSRGEQQREKHQQRLSEIRRREMLSRRPAVVEKAPLAQGPAPTLQTTTAPAIRPIPNASVPPPGILPIPTATRPPVITPAAQGPSVIPSAFAGQSDMESKRAQFKALRQQGVPVEEAAQRVGL